MLRITTSGVLKSYRLNLNQSHTNLFDAQKTVLTQHNFNSYAEDPATASECFTLRRSLLRTSAQQSVCSTVISQYDVAWSTIDNLIGDVSNEKATSAFASVLAGLNGTTGSGRHALGANLLQISESLTQSMNVKYGDSYVFSGSNGLTVPFSWEGDKLCYQGVPVDAPQNSVDAAQLKALANQTRYVDIGLGMQMDENNNLITSSAFDAAMPGINYLGYGVDDEGVPNNVISIIHRMGTILSRCNEDGSWRDDADQKEITKLFAKFDEVSSNLSKMHVEMDTKASFLKSNLEQLENAAYTLNEQIVDLEEVDLAEAITSFSWAQYCYNAALKVGNSILSDTLMDYMN